MGKRGTRLAARQRKTPAGASFLSGCLPGQCAGCVCLPGQALSPQADPNIASRFVIGTRWEIPSLDDVKPVFDFLLDLLECFAFGQWLPALFVAEKLIGVEQLHRIDPSCVDRFHLAFDECTNRVTFQQQFFDPLRLFLGTGYLAIIPDQLLGAFQSPVQDPRSFLFQQHLREVGDLLLDRLAVVFDPAHPAIPCLIVGIDVDCQR